MLQDSVHSPMVPSPLVSTIIGHQPCAFWRSFVSSQIRVLIHPIAFESPEKYSVLSLSSANCKWCVEKHTSNGMTWLIRGS